MYCVFRTRFARSFHMIHSIGPNKTSSPFTFWDRIWYSQDEEVRLSHFVLFLSESLATFHTTESNLSRTSLGAVDRTVCWSLRPTPWWRLVSLLMHGSDLIDVSAPALHGCRRPFIVSTIRHGAVASRPWRRNELNEHFIFPDGMASKRCRCHYNRVLSIIIYL